MKEFSVCYDRFCLGNYTLICDVCPGHVERWAGGDDEGIR